MTTPNLMLAEIPEAILTASDELNESLWAIDAILQLSVVSRSTSLPSSATQGSRYIVASGDRQNHVAYMTPIGWRYFVPRRGWLADVADEDISVKFDGTAWQEAGAAGSPSATQKATWVRGGGLALETPVVDVDVYCPVDQTITGIVIMTQGGNGSCVVDIWKTALGTFPPTSANTICGSSKPEISSGATYLDTTLTGWTVSISAGEMLRFHLESTDIFNVVAVTLLTGDAA